MSHHPIEPFRINGGCNCSAIRYILATPSEHQRQLFLSAEKSNGQGDIRAPQTAACLCNDRRRASGDLVLFALLVPFTQTTFSLLGKDSKERMSFPATDHLPPKHPSSPSITLPFADTYLSMYQSSDKVLRAFYSIRSP